MKNVRDNQKKTCIFLEVEEFNSILHQLFGNEIETDYSLDGVYVGYENGDNLDTQELHDKLAQYFDVESVTSIHIDDADMTGVWIVYKGDSYEYPDKSKRDFIGQIIDIFEDYCDDNNISIPNEDRDDEIARAMEEDSYESKEACAKELGLAIIYGQDYDTIANAIESTIYDDESPTDTFRKEDCIPAYEVNSIIDDTIEAFLNLLPDVETFAAVDETKIKNDLLDTFKQWDLVGELYYVTGRLDTRTTFAVKADDINDAIKKGEERLESLDIGDIGECVSSYINMVEQDDDIVWDRP